MPRILKLLPFLVACTIAVAPPKLSLAQPQRPANDNVTVELANIKKENPIVSDVGRYNRPDVWSLLGKLDFLAANPGGPARTGSPPTSAELAQIAANRKFALAYDHNPSATLALLRSTNEFLRKARLNAGD